MYTSLNYKILTTSKRDAKIMVRSLVFTSALVHSPVGLIILWEYDNLHLHSFLSTVFYCFSFLYCYELK